MDNEIPTELLVIPELCVTALMAAPQPFLTFVPEGSEENVAPPLAFSTNPLKLEPDKVTVTVEPAAALLGAEILVEGLEAREPWPGVEQELAPLEYAAAS